MVVDKISIASLRIEDEREEFYLTLENTRKHRGIRVPVVYNHAQRIQLALDRIRPPRPLSHDLIRNIIDSMKGHLVEARVSAVEDDEVFVSELIFWTAQGDEIVLGDVATGDAVALALQCGCSVTITEPVLVQFEGYAHHSADDWKIRRLHDDLRRAVDKEKYEDAAKIRDEIKRLQN